MSPPRYLRADGTPAPAYLVAGEDEGLVAQQLVALIEELAELDSNPGAIEEYGEAGEDEPVIGPVLDACRTPPFLTERRVVVVRDHGSLDAAAQKELIAYLKDPLETTVLVVALLGRRTPAALGKAFAAAGVVLNTEPQSGARGRQQWFSEHLADAPVRLDAASSSLLDKHLGGDLARVAPLLEALAAAYGPHARISPAELEPFLGTAGDTTPWDLTDALADGDGVRAINSLQRQLGTDRHPLQVLASLHRHYGAMLALDGANITDERDAASLTGLAPYPAKKALEQTRRLGHERVTRAITLIASADLDLRGRLAWPGELVLEVLVARLAQLSRMRGHSSARPRAASGRGRPATRGARQPAPARAAGGDDGDPFA